MVSFEQDKDNNGKALNYRAKNEFTENDQFILFFDFVNKSLTIHHNNNIADQIPMKYSTIIPAFSISCNEGEEIQITKCFMYM